MTAILGYARVNTAVQNLDTQLTVLAAAGVESGRIFTDKFSGATNAARPGLPAMLDCTRGGDTAVVTAIDRLGQSVAEVTCTIAELGRHRIVLRASREGVDSAIPTGRAVAATWPRSLNLSLNSAAERRTAYRYLSTEPKLEPAP